MARPSKMPKFLIAMDKVLNDDINAIIMTDEELLLMANEELAEAEQISDTTFENWKGWRIEDEELYKGFLVLYKKAILKQKSDLFWSMKTDSQWQRYAWIIERKFDAWNLRNIWVQKSVNVNVDKEDIDNMSNTELEEMRKKLMS